jgi:hypothetical protein
LAIVDPGLPCTTSTSYRNRYYNGKETLFNVKILKKQNNKIRGLNRIHKWQ